MCFQNHPRCSFLKLNKSCQVRICSITPNTHPNLHHPFRISELGNLVQKFSTLPIWGFSTADKSFALEQLLKVVHGGKVMFILIETFPGLEIIARWGPLPFNMVLLSNRAIKPVV